MKVIGLQTSIWNNRFKTLFLISLMPILTVLVIFGIYYAGTQDFSLSVNKTEEIMIYGIPLMLVWLIIGIFFQKQIIFKFSGAREISRKEQPEIYNIVENLCISRGIPMPKIGILEDNSLNAFATGWNKNNSWIVFSEGLLKKLDKAEIEAVAGHELTHIMNEDIKIMVISVVFIGFIGTIGEILLRSGHSSSSSNNKGSNPLPLIGLGLYLLSLILLPLINLAISRKREFLADAGSVELIGDKEPMINALKKISQDSVIESIEKDNIAAMCIANPTPKKSSIFASIKNLFSTHPTIDDRIALLEKY